MKLQLIRKITAEGQIDRRPCFFGLRNPLFPYNDYNSGNARIMLI